MDLALDVPLGRARLRTLTIGDAALVVEATRAETRSALWGPRPAGPYSLAQATDALGKWRLGVDRQISYGVVENGRLLGAVGLMVDAGSDGARRSAELAYWVRPERRREGIALSAVRTITEWGTQHVGLTRLWLEIDPGNLASQGLAPKAGYRFTERLPAHCRLWISDDRALDRWHDCLIWTYDGRGAALPPA